jgi:hypothetical protein
VFYDHTDAKGNSSKLEVKISGTGPWKELNVFDAETGIVVLEKKFYKNDFADIMRDPTYAAFVNAVIDSAYTLGADVEPGEGQSGEEDEDE